jgi:3-hexulose-6-phosphate synthase/6-phospho-3-hexuloisomerase
MWLKSEQVILQHAVDVIDLSKAVEVAKASVKGGVDWVEVGTPLIKAEGIESVRFFKEVFPNIPIVADLKTMDMGEIEVTLAAKAGADIVMICTAAPDETTVEAVKAGRKHNVRIMASLMGEKHPISRALRVEGLAVDSIIVHTGLDEGRKRGPNFSLLSKVARAVELPMAIGGGINKDNVLQAVLLKARIIIVGRAISNAKKPTFAASEIKEEIDKARTELKSRGRMG